MTKNFNLSCILFDLDGTLIDTAPDLIACLNQALSQYGFAEVALNTIRPYISLGATVMIKKSVASDVSRATQQKILDTMLNNYQNNIAQYSQLFTGISKTLETIKSLHLKWGIVTNKRQRFTQPLVAALNLTQHAHCVISGDTTAHDKPHPEPLLAACLRTRIKPEECVYIGDALHDIVAGKNANMKTLVATYGYLKPDDTPAKWGADGLIESPAQLTAWITKMCYV